MMNEGKVFIAVITVIGLGLIWLVVAGYRSVAAEQEKWAVERKLRLEFIHKCIDLGGYPVQLETYVKGVGEGHVCIKSVETIN